MATCLFCGVDEELRLGCCWDCANSGEMRAAKRTVAQHLAKAIDNLRRCRWFNAKCDLRWAWERFTRTGDYATNGYFDKHQPDWRKRP